MFTVAVILLLEADESSLGQRITG
jgi:uncharacterized protein